MHALPRLGFRDWQAYLPCMKPMSTSVQRWRVTRIVGNAARQITELRAKSAEEAIKRTIKEFDIADPQQQSRLAAHRVA